MAWPPSHCCPSSTNLGSTPKLSNGGNNKIFCKGPLTIRRTLLPSFLVNFSTFAFLFSFFFSYTMLFPPVIHNFRFNVTTLQLPLEHGNEYYIRGDILKKNWNPYIFFQRNALMDIKISIIDICYANTAPIPKTVMVSLLHKWKI